MTDTPKATPVFEALVLETLYRICDHLWTMECDQAALHGVEMPSAPRFTIPTEITSAAGRAAVTAAAEVARGIATANNPAAGANFREVERDADGRVSAVIDPVAAVRRRAVRDADGRVVGFHDEYLGGGA